ECALVPTRGTRGAVPPIDPGITGRADHDQIDVFVLRQVAYHLPGRADLDVLFVRQALRQPARARVEVAPRGLFHDAGQRRGREPERVGGEIEGDPDRIDEDEP